MMNRDDAVTVGRQHLFDQVKAQQEIARELKELNANLKALIEVLAQRKRPPRKRRGE